MFQSNILCLSVLSFHGCWGQIGLPPHNMFFQKYLIYSIFLSHYLQNGLLISQEFIVILSPLLSSTAFESLYIFFISLIAHLGEEKEKYEVKLPCLIKNPTVFLNLAACLFLYGWGCSAFLKEHFVGIVVTWAVN